MTFAVLPVKAPQNAKQRLKALLSPGAREALARAMFEEMLEKLCSARNLDRVAVATSDEQAADRARRAGALVFAETEQRGHSHSADAAARRAMELGARTVLLLPIDVPLATTAEIEELADAARPGVLIVPSADGTGTNALVRTPPDAIESRFGPGSLRAHLEQARSKGVPAWVLRPSGIVFDLDTPEDATELIARAPHSLYGPSPPIPMDIRITGLTGLPEIRPGDDLPTLIHEAAGREGRPIDARTIVVVAQKIVSKAEGALIDLRELEPSPLAQNWAARWDKDARLIELILRESRRIVKMDRGVLITETRHGFIAANAGVDQSNVASPHHATILPADPDASARRLRGALSCGAAIVSDTFGRPWREGLVNVAIGVSGLAPLEDLRGCSDRDGRPLAATIVATADELASAASLLMRKSAGVPVVLIYGMEWTAAETSARELIRAADRDLFR